MSISHMISKSQKFNSLMWKNHWTVGFQMAEFRG